MEIIPAALNLATALLLGAAIGFERQWRQRDRKRLPIRPAIWITQPISPRSPETKRLCGHHTRITQGAVSAALWARHPVSETSAWAAVPRRGYPA